jgi:hypothetical protein
LTLRPAGRHAGVVDADVDATEPLESRLHEQGSICGVGDVAAQRVDPPSSRSERVESFEAPSTRDDARTRVREHGREPGAEPARGACDDRHPLGERSDDRRHDGTSWFCGFAAVDNLIGVVLP